MYKVECVYGDDKIIDFEKRRVEAFDGKKDIKTIKNAPYGKAIKDGDMLALNCLEGDKAIGGVLLDVKGEDLHIERLFVDFEKRGNGVGTFLLEYIDKNKGIFEDYFGLSLDGILLEPLQSNIDYYYDRGYDSFGFQMYKSF